MNLDKMELEVLKQFDKRITKDIYNVLNTEKSVNRKNSEGGTSPRNVKKSASYWKERLKDEE